MRFSLIFILLVGISFGQELPTTIWVTDGLEYSSLETQFLDSLETSFDDSDLFCITNGDDGMLFLSPDMADITKLTSDSVLAISMIWYAWDEDYYEYYTLAQQIYIVPKDSLGVYTDFLVETTIEILSDSTEYVYDLEYDDSIEIRNL